MPNKSQANFNASLYQQKNNNSSQKIVMKTMKARCWGEKGIVEECARVVEYNKCKMHIFANKKQAENDNDPGFRRIHMKRMVRRKESKLENNTFWTGVNDPFFYSFFLNSRCSSIVYTPWMCFSFFLSE